MALTPTDAVARLALSRELLRAGALAEAVTEAKAVIVGPGARAHTRMQRAQAARILGELWKAGQREAPPQSSTGVDSAQQRGAPSIDEEALALWQAATSGDMDALRSRTAGHLSPRYALGALVDAGRGGDAKAASAALGDGLRLAAQAGLWPWLQDALAQAAQGAGRPALAVALAVDGDPLSDRGGAGLRSLPEGERLAALSAIAESAERLGFPAAALRLASTAQAVAYAQGKKDEEAKLKQRVAALKAIQRDEEARRKPLVLARLSIGALGAPPAPKLVETDNAVKSGPAPSIEAEEGTP